MAMEFLWLLKFSVCIFLHFRLVLCQDYPEVIESNSCNTLKSLGKNLYSTGESILSLMEIFYPPHRVGVSFLRVKYEFENETGGLDGCSVTYLWAVGGFLLYQPPTIFQFTSLLFNHKDTNSGNLTLRLPSICRQLVMVNDSKCSCEAGEHLEVLTHQVSELCTSNESLFINSLMCTCVCSLNYTPSTLKCHK